LTSSHQPVFSSLITAEFCAHQPSQLLGALRRAHLRVVLAHEGVHRHLLGAHARLEHHACARAHIRDLHDFTVLWPSM
jgi:hypothetical protein